MRQQGRAAAELPLMMAANRRWQRLSEELGADLEWQMGGNLRLTNDPAQAARYEEWAKLAADRGLDTRVVSDSEIRSILSAGAGDWLLGIFTASDGHVNPVATCQAYEAVLRSRGVRIVEGLPAEAIVTAGGRVRGVRTPLGEISRRYGRPRRRERQHQARTLARHRDPAAIRAPDRRADRAGGTGDADRGLDR